jgi:mevalonate kinase
MRRLARARAPAKLILSGEHAVVYGKPALAMATHYYTESIAEASLSSLALSRHVAFRLPQLQYAKQLTLATLKKLTRRVRQDYQSFLAGDCSIREVLKKPVELIQFTVANLLDLSQAMIQSMDVQTYSTIPIGCGMGSSAALVMSTLRAVSKLFNLELETEAYLRLGIDAENLQHGYSSGLDIQLIWQGGCVYFKEGKAVARPLSTLPLYGVNTGKPLSTTGECVMHARQYFLKSTIADDFEAVTHALDSAFLENNRAAIQSGIKENHRLLCQVGVVPESVARFVAALESVGAAAKISGAGAIRGDAAGMVLVVPETVESVRKVVDAFGFSIERIQGDSHGTQLL